MRLEMARGGEWFLGQAGMLAGVLGKRAALAARSGHRPERVYHLAREAAHWGRVALGQGEGGER